MRSIVLIAHNLRSAHNIGSLLRTAEGLGIEKVYLTGYSPYPRAEQDDRLPHIAEKTDKQIAKTALGAEHSIAWEHRADIAPLVTGLKQAGYLVSALEQVPGSTPLPEFKAPDKVAVIVGREVEGVEPEVLDACDAILEIPMAGKKESFNVAAAAAMTLYALRFD
ncbi:MAG TPA: TrmH family RNA methyltransferase [Candidatus Saccharimonadales bacterium]|nr:TrmH family RNA methyltransferase [Candidatus Saccharimonadales bacterium]